MSSRAALAAWRSPAVLCIPYPVIRGFDLRIHKKTNNKPLTAYHIIHTALKPKQTRLNGNIMRIFFFMACIIEFFRLKEPNIFYLS